MPIPTVPKLDPQTLIIGLLAVKFLQQNGGQPIILSSQEMKDLAQFTVRLEIMNPQEPATSPIKCTVISMEDAVKMMNDMKRARGK